ncbi:diiron oxygenase [Acidiferrimicrobium sp. IK]|uniref:AurF N-oxygenase family protein n=1 Tax=Acidiferrimicrobium sp. IK TaxID=2871700 RepID=UPI0021CB9000|nr:diiron oxygenase [Acidiferrimicrobium sp. IK]MCU4184749.1 diiron oxygenase [Acidiferrimicrobium sp. IK]
MTVTEPTPITTADPITATGPASGAASAAPGGGEDRDATFASIVRRLSKQSVEKHFDAYADIDWDDPLMAIDPADPRFLLWTGDPLGATEWYRSQPADVQSRVALYRVASAMRTGWEFENVLQRGLLNIAFWMPNGAEQFRYLHHETIEESQHSLMFQEFVNRTGMPVHGMPTVIKKAAERAVLPLSRRFPELFFLFVLGGEDPVDHLQRQQLRRGGVHPLVERIMRIHVTEEARHVSYARNYLKAEVPKLGRVRRGALSLITPPMFGVMTRLMVDVPPSMSFRAGVPKSVISEARKTPKRAKLLVEASAKPRKLCEELGLMNPVSRRLWKLFGVAGGPET